MIFGSLGPVFTASFRHVSWALACVLLSSCSALLSVPETQCANVGDCVGRGFVGAACVDGACVAQVADDRDASASDPIWGCVGKVSWPAEDPTRTIVDRGQFLRIFSEAPIPGLVLRACRGIDATCASPIRETITDAEGYYSLTLPFAFRGYLETRPTPAQEVLAMLLPVVTPAVMDLTDASRADSVHASSAIDLGSLLDIIGRKLNPDEGHIFGLAVDCQGRPVQGVTLEATPTAADSIAYYVDDNRLPNLTQKFTSSRGELGFVNLPPGPVTLHYSAAGRRVGSTTVQMRKATVTAVGLAPTPLVAE